MVGERLNQGPAVGEVLSKQSFCRTLRRSSAVKMWSPGPSPFLRCCTHRSIRASGRACSIACKSLSLKAEPQEEDDLVEESGLGDRSWSVASIFASETGAGSVDCFRKE